MGHHPAARPVDGHPAAIGEHELRARVTEVDIEDDDEVLVVLGHRTKHRLPMGRTQGQSLRHARVHSAHEDAPSSLYAAGWLAALSEDAEVALEGSLLLDTLLPALGESIWMVGLATAAMLKVRQEVIVPMVLLALAQMSKPLPVPQPDWVSPISMPLSASP